MYTKIIAEGKKVLCGQNTKLFTAHPDGRYSNHRSSKIKNKICIKPTTDIRKTNTK